MKSIRRSLDELIGTVAVALVVLLIVAGPVALILVGLLLPVLMTAALLALVAACLWDTTIKWLTRRHRR